MDRTSIEKFAQGVRVLEDFITPITLTHIPVKLATAQAHYP